MVWTLIPNEDRKPSQFLEARPDGERPSVTYKECIEEMGRKVSKSMGELKRMPQDRKKVEVSIKKVEVFH